MIKTIGKFIWRIAKCVIGAVGVCYAGYYISLGLNWLTAHIMKLLASAGTYVMGNWVSIVVIGAVLIIGGGAFEYVADYVRNAVSNRTAKPKKKKEDKSVYLEDE